MIGVAGVGRLRPPPEGRQQRCRFKTLGAGEDARPATVLDFVANRLGRGAGRSVS